MIKELSRAHPKTTSQSKRSLINGRERDDYFIPFPQSHLLNLSYDELEAKNLEFKKHRLAGKTSGEVRDEMLEYLAAEKGIKAVTVCFTNLEGRLHILDYDKKYLVGSESNLTFDGSSIKGFTELSNSDLRLKVDWTSFRWVPADIFGPGKVLVFGNVYNRDGTCYSSDFRSSLFKLCKQLQDEKDIVVNVAPEIEGFIFKGQKAEQNFDSKTGFKLPALSGYFNSLPHDILRVFIDKLAEAQRALGFQNEKDHPEVAPSQFELNFKYSVAIDTADQIQLYKLLARQIADTMGLTACFLPKPVQNLNGTGMHMNMSFSRNGKNIFYDSKSNYLLATEAHNFITGILYHANDLCLVMNSSVNAYRRLDPNFEAPNEIIVSAVNRGAMIRIPEGNENSARIEIRTVAPDVNPYLCIYALLHAGLKGISADASDLKKWGEKVYGGRVKILPENIYVAMDYFRKSRFIREILGTENQKKYVELKFISAERCPRAFGKTVKDSEILYHHEITNQLIWDEF